MLGHVTASPAASEAAVHGASQSPAVSSHAKNGMMEGYTDNYIKVVVPYRSEWVNEIINWKL